MASGLLRTFAGKWRHGLVRLLLKSALTVSTPDGFMNAINDRIRDRVMRDYLLELGADKLFDNVYAMARNDVVLRDYLLGDAAGRMFRSLYDPALKVAESRDYMIEYGINDLYRCVDAMALDLGTPVSERVGGYGQEGEDLILTRLFEGQDVGFYVDVGAHHPFRFSNTYLLYQRGWRGINIDAMPGSMREFCRWRPRDINLECLVSCEPASYTFFQYDEPALNTVSEKVVQKRKIDSPRYQVAQTLTLEARPLSEILVQHLPTGIAIDLLNVDVEGHDLQVLLSNDWNRFRPRVIVAEILGTPFSEMEKEPLYRFLAEQGYRLHSKLFNSAIFI